MELRRARWARRAVAFGIVLLVAAAHVVGIGRHAQGELFRLYYSFFSDVVIPFAYYFLLCQSEDNLPLLRSWIVKSAVVFLLPATAETLQYFGVPLLGSTFDPLDYLMYAAGALAAALVDVQLLSRVFGFWMRARAEA